MDIPASDRKSLVLKLDVLDGLRECIEGCMDDSPPDTIDLLDLPDMTDRPSSDSALNPTSKGLQ